MKLAFRSLALFSAMTLVHFACAAHEPDASTRTAPNAETAATATATATPAACSADECAKVAEPPISPLACGAGHERDIGTACERAASGECQKVLTCAGKRP